MSPPAQPHHVYVVSDLHLGGRAPSANRASFQMCPLQARQRLARFVGALTSRSGEFAAHSGSVELVINGDFIDFLAQEPFADFTRDANAALCKLNDAIASCDEESDPPNQVFTQLAAFVQAGHKLTLLLGNHDLELSWPPVRRELLAQLTGNLPARVEFLFDGEAYRLGDLLIEHGNRYDGWNAVTHGALRAIRSAHSRGEPLGPFVAPAGSRLVASVMNPLKERYRFIDLLKPENEAVLPILIALEPEVLRNLPVVASLAFDKSRASGPTGRVRPEETFIASTKLPTTMTTRLIPDPTHDLTTSEETLAVLAQAELDAKLFLESSYRLRIEHTMIAAGSFSWLQSPLSWRSHDRQIWSTRHDWLAKVWRQRAQRIGHTFAIGADDPPYINAARRLIDSGTARVVVMGHSHLPRAIVVGKGGLYLNCGTWCPTIELPADFLKDNQGDPVTQSKILNFLSDLTHNHLEQWLNLKTCFAHLVLVSDRVASASLCQVREDNSIEILYPPNSGREA